MAQTRNTTGADSTDKKKGPAKAAAAAKPRVLGRTQLEEDGRRRVELVDLTPHGVKGAVWIREISGFEIASVSVMAEVEIKKVVDIDPESNDALKAGVELVPFMIAYCLCEDEEGAPMYSDKEIPTAAQNVKGWKPGVQGALQAKIFELSDLNATMAERTESLKDTPGE